MLAQSDGRTGRSESLCHLPNRDSDGAGIKKGGHEN